MRHHLRHHLPRPANGMVIALDPDIPAGHQRVLISVQGAQRTMRLLLNDRILGPATSPQLWTPRAGTYHLTLEDGHGGAISRVSFTVRDAPAGAED